MTFINEVLATVVGISAFCLGVYFGIYVLGLFMEKNEQIKRFFEDNKG